jgi:hypothetical protein
LAVQPSADVVPEVNFRFQGKQQLHSMRGRVFHVHVLWWTIFADVPQWCTSFKEVQAAKCSRCVCVAKHCAAMVQLETAPAFRLSTNRLVCSTGVVTDDACNTVSGVAQQPCPWWLPNLAAAGRSCQTPSLVARACCNDHSLLCSTAFCQGMAGIPTCLIPAFVIPFVMQTPVDQFVTYLHTYDMDYCRQLLMLIGYYCLHSLSIFLLLEWHAACVAATAMY